MRNHLAILFFCLSVCAYSQPFPLSVEQLSYSRGAVNSILQDQKGMMWFGTSYGLVRYDGYDFRRFSPEENANEQINADNLLEDSRGNIWGSLSLVADEVSVFFNKEDMLTHGTAARVFKFNPRREKFDLFQIDTGVLEVNSFAEDRQGNIWIGTTNGLARIADHDSEASISRFFKLKRSENEAEFPFEWNPIKNEYFVVNDKASELWIFSKNKFQKLSAFSTGEEADFNDINLFGKNGAQNI